jgi:hypothetical protein
MPGRPRRRAGIVTTILAATLAATSLAGVSTPAAAPVKVRLVEGNARGFLVLRTLKGDAIAHGELTQRPRGGRIESRLALSFVDGSVWDERVTFSQDEVFRLETYRLTQHGPSFPTSAIAFERERGRFEARTQEKKGDEVKEASGALEIPADVYNGMALVLLKNVRPGPGASVRIVAFTPKPRLVSMELLHEGDDVVRLGAATHAVRRHLVRLEVGGVTGMIAPLIGKDPPDLRYWLATGDVPAFVRFEGAMYLNGPVWRLEMTTVEWPR